jgi:hypothetical protein
MDERPTRGGHRQPSTSVPEGGKITRFFKKAPASAPTTTTIPVPTPAQRKDAPAATPSTAAGVVKAKETRAPNLLGLPYDDSDEEEEEEDGHCGSPVIVVGETAADVAIVGQKTADVQIVGEGHATSGSIVDAYRRSGVIPQKLTMAERRARQVNQQRVTGKQRRKVHGLGRMRSMSMMAYIRDLKVAVSQPMKHTGIRRGGGKRGSYVDWQVFHKRLVLDEGKKRRVVETGRGWKDMHFWLVKNLPCFQDLALTTMREWMKAGEASLVRKVVKGISYLSDGTMQRVSVEVPVLLTP